MESHLSVAIVPQMVPVSAREVSQAAVELGQALQDLNAAKAAGGKTDVMRAEGAYRAAEDAYKVEVKPAGLLARINGTEIPITDFAVGPDEHGNPVLTISLLPDSIQIGDPSTGTTAPDIRPAAPQVASWGGSVHPDPRESIPGWQPEKLSEQVAGHAERVALRTWEPSEGQEKTSALKRLIRLGSSAVTA